VTPSALSKAPRTTGYLLLFSGMALVGTYTALSKPLSEALPVFLLAWLRFAIAAVVMIPWLRAHEHDVPLTLPLWRILFVQSLFGNFLFSILILTGVALTSAAAAGIVMAALPPLVALLSWAVLRERAGWRVWVATGLAAGAIALLSSQASASAGAGAGAGHLLGNFLILGAAGCEAIYVVLGKRLTGSLSPRRISALINLVGLALMTPLGLWQATRFDFAQLSGPLWALLVFYSLSASMVSTWLWLSGLKQVPASHSGVFTVALPLAATAVAVALLGETIGALHLVALGCAVAGIALVAWPDTRERG
jgi:drug/metabolite transporter (DMT)-like permease